MKRYHCFASAAVLASLFMLSGCSKLRDRFFPPPVTDSARLCRIESILIDTRGLIYGDTGAPTPTTYRYNASNDPTEEITSGGVVFYTYDSKSRLINAISHPTKVAGNNGWAKYFYPTTNSIIDSFYEGPSNLSDPNPPTDPGVFIYVDKMDLDTTGRVIRVIRSFPPGDNFPSTTTNYPYDANGNLIWPNNNLDGFVKYDNKINPYRTSKTWELLYLNYSRNNAYEDYDGLSGPVTYNAQGLPTHFVGPEPTAPFTGYFSTIDITYSCDAPRH